MEFFWRIFENSGSIEAYLGYRETMSRKTADNSVPAHPQKQDILKKPMGV